MVSDALIVLQEKSCLFIEPPLEQRVEASLRSAKVDKFIVGFADDNTGAILKGERELVKQGSLRLSCAESHDADDNKDRGVFSAAKAAAEEDIGRSLMYTLLYESAHRWNDGHSVDGWLRTAVTRGANILVGTSIPVLVKNGPAYDAEIRKAGGTPSSYEVAKTRLSLALCLKRHLMGDPGERNRSQYELYRGLARAYGDELSARIDLDTADEQIPIIMETFVRTVQKFAEPNGMLHQSSVMSLHQLTSRIAHRLYAQDRPRYNVMKPQLEDTLAVLKKIADHRR